MAARGRRSSPTARLLVLVGIVAVLGGTFLAGVYAGRIWSARAAVVAAHVPDTEPARRGPGRGGRLPEVPAPQLTFYRELTAPLTPPPPPPRPAVKPAARREAVPPAPPIEPAKPSVPSEMAAAPIAEAPVVAASLRADGGRYTVQVGSYNVRAQADALRARLASSGLDAYVAEGEAGGVTRYRVRIGAFLSAGIDSTAVVALARETGATDLQTMTLRFSEYRGRDNDESRQAASPTTLTRPSGDRRGHHPSSWYKSTMKPVSPPPSTGNHAAAAGCNKSALLKSSVTFDNT